MSNKSFWNKEYASPENLTLSTEHSSDLETFEKWAIRNSEWFPFPKDGVVLDVGCGNGRNSLYLCSQHDMKGIGFDISGVAVDQAKKATEQLVKSTGKKIDMSWFVQSASEPLPAESESVDVVIDLMTSHFLREKEREQYVQEIVRVMKPYGWLLFKTFILDGDFHAKRLIAEHPDPGEIIHDADGNKIGSTASESNSYIHPRIGVYEHVWTESEIHEVFGPYFKIYKTIKSYKHVRDGKPYKRRTVSVYMEKKRLE
jgi:SAM-dependent methyltransferase